MKMIIMISPGLPGWSEGLCEATKHRLNVQILLKNPFDQILLQNPFGQILLQNRVDQILLHNRLDQVPCGGDLPLPRWCEE